MVALRKDVKVGLAVGGITLAVVAVYVGLSAMSGKPAAPGSGDSSIVDTAGKTTPADSGTTVAKTDSSSAAAPQTPVATATPATPANSTPAPKSASSDDVWANAFSSGTIQPAVTVTPSLNSAREQAAKPNEVIQALTNPKTPEAAPQQSASATDPSGSLAANSPTPTLTRTTNATTEPTPTAGGTTHVVKPGETFSSIAADHYGDATLYTVIIKANPNVDPNRMKSGVTLNLPARDKAAKPANGAAAAPASVDPARQYVVKPGDSLEGIASALYGDRAKWESIYASNKSVIGDSPARLKVGMVLSLPTAPTKK